MAEQKRFHKPFHFFHAVKKQPLRCMKKIFQTLHLDDIRYDIEYWQQLALANDNSAYDEGSAREDLMDFCQQFLKLIEALHVLNNSSNSRKKWLSKLPSNVRKEVAEMNQPERLSEDEIAKPKLVIKAFCNSFSYSYAKDEISDLLDAVITYEGEKKVYKNNLILSYRCMKCLLRIAYINSKKKNLPGTNK